MQVSARLELPARQKRRKPHRLRVVCGSGACDECVEAQADVLEGGAAAIESRHARLEEQAARQELVAERRLIRSRGTDV